MKDELIHKYFRVETTPAEEKEILDWLDDDPVENKKYFDKLHFLHIKEMLFIDDIPETPKARPNSRVYKILRYAGAVAAVFILTIVVGNIVRKNTEESFTRRMASITVPAGQRMNMVLEDGTSIWLNAGTTMDYPVVFSNKSRKVRISGEAMFEVMHDTNRPFIVETFASQIEVQGTTFNVIAEKSRGTFSTTLVSGKIKVTNMLDNNDVIIMKPNDIVNLKEGRMFLGKMNDPTALRWTEGLISLQDISFVDLMAKFEKAFDVKIIINRKKIPVMDITSGKIRVSDGVEQALRILQRGAKFTFEKDVENNVITIR